ncbi:MAG TPA: hypothetical protein VGO67_08550 [Verrucomicrobiae bacterium]
MLTTEFEPGKSTRPQFVPQCDFFLRLLKPETTDIADGSHSTIL